MAIIHAIGKMASCWDMNLKTKSYQYVNSYILCNPFFEASLLSRCTL